MGLQARWYRTAARARHRRGSEVLYETYTNSVATPIPTRFSDDEIALIDQLVDAGLGDSRSAVIRRGIHVLADATRRAQIGHAIATSYREQPQTPEDDELAMASAIAMTEAEPW